MGVRVQGSGFTQFGELAELHAKKMKATHTVDESAPPRAPNVLQFPWCEISSINRL